MSRQLKLRDRFLKKLREWCKKLPEEVYIAYHKEFTYSDIAGLPPVITTNPEEHLVNHYRRCKRLFINYGYFAVEDYFNKRGFLLVDKEGMKENEKAAV